MGVCLGVCANRFGKDAHEFRELMREQSQHGGEGAEAGREEDEEGELLLGVHRHLVEHCFTRTQTHTKRQVSDVVAGLEVGGVKGVYSQTSTTRYIFSRNEQFENFCNAQRFLSKAPLAGKSSESVSLRANSNLTEYSSGRK